MKLDLYKTTTMLPAVQRMTAPTSFLKNTFFPDGATFYTEEVLLDYTKGKRKMAPFVAPRVGGITMDREGYKTLKYLAPKISPQRAITIDDLVLRGLGENVISSKTPQQRQIDLLAKDIRELSAMISRRQEWMSAQALLNGRIVMKGYTDRSDKDYVEDVLDYNFTNKEILEGTDRWGQGGNIYEDLESWKLEITQKTDVTVDMAIMGRDALKAFRSDATILKLMDIRNMNNIEYKPVYKGEGVSYIGRIAELNLDIYTYDSWYLDDDNVLKPYIPANTVILAKANLGETLYGAITQMEKSEQFITYEGKIVPRSWADVNAETRMIRLASRPVPKPNDADEWFVAQVV
ncbi:major capsid protein [Bacillus sp. Au-Bac7]|uniref:major capsid protein n=1 Tax=Bacillus sp. Au-Bac7 TaxID=2906458 RepID=UPI001E374BD3|nr:major capsid protein [Bacillus sp. Au-Bac7]MCE4048030.1 major capsid protein [Bacillus sp. Au-Bac7]